MTDTSLDRPLAARPLRSPLRWLGMPVAAAVFLAGVWLAGGVITDSFRGSMALVAAWYAIAGAGAVAVARRRRRLGTPLLAGYAIAAVAVAAYLGLSTLRDRVVDERVATGPVAARGAFTAGAHDTSGSAAVVATGAGRAVLTLTGFETDPGPDLRVRLVAGAATGGDAAGAIDLGALKGNRGDQQYALPAGAPRDATVVIWCRAFSVTFGTARLRAT